MKKKQNRKKIDKKSHLKRKKRKKEIIQIIQSDSNRIFFSQDDRNS